MQLTNFQNRLFGFALRHWKNLEEEIERHWYRVVPGSSIQARWAKERPIAFTCLKELGPGATTVLDVGARWGVGEAWWNLNPLAKIVGFDPDPIECARLNAAAKSGETYVPFALGATPNSEVPLYVTKEPAGSSLYPPLDNVIERFPEELGRMLPLEKTIQVPTTSLDDWWSKSGRPQISFLKLDTQGSELDILKGGTRVLHDCVGLELEVEFNPFYQGQPLFADVDAFLRKEGFSLWALSELVSHRPHSLSHRALNAQKRRTEWGPAKAGQLYWANAIYFRSWQTHDLLGWKKRLLLSAFLEASGDINAAEKCLPQR